jgi:2-phosphosulfolactate phosphatase
MDQQSRLRSPFDQSGFDVRFDWGVAGLESIGHAATVVVIVDILSFTTSVDVATGRGATVLPFAGEATAVDTYAAANRAVPAGRSRGKPGAWTLSPASLETIPSGTRLVMPSPNGSTLSAHAGLTGSVVVTGCLRNAAAVASMAADIGPPIAVIAAGERREHHATGLRVALEDMIGAGAIMAKLTDHALSPEACAAVAAFHAAEPTLVETLRSSGSGRELVERGFAEDVALAARQDVSSTVAVLTAGAFVAQPPAE